MPYLLLLFCIYHSIFQRPSAQLIYYIYNGVPLCRKYTDYFFYGVSPMLCFFQFFLRNYKCGLPIIPLSPSPHFCNTSTNLMLSSHHFCQMLPNVMSASQDFRQMPTNVMLASQHFCETPANVLLASQHFCKTPTNVLLAFQDFREIKKYPCFFVSRFSGDANQTLFFYS